MRVPAILLLAACAAMAQFKSTVPLVVSPVTITDAKDHPVDGLTADDLILYDNNVTQAIQLDTAVNPISLVVVVQSSSNSAAILDKLGPSGALFAQLVAGETGETAVLSFSDRVRTVQGFTTDSGVLSRALRSLRVEGDHAVVLEALMEALRLLDRQRPERRRIILAIAEKRDRSSHIQLPTVIEEIERRNVAIYWLTYSPFLTPFTNRPKTVGDREPEEERGKDPDKDAQALPPDVAPGSLLSVFTELAHAVSPIWRRCFHGLPGRGLLVFLNRRRWKGPSSKLRERCTASMF